MSDGEDQTFKSDFLEYHRSLADELKAIKNRVKYLTSHRTTQGCFKEAALRSVLRRHLPEKLRIGTGFIVNERSECSTQIDLLLVDSDHPTLFKDGDLLIVTPSAVRGVIEVKTTLSGQQELTNATRRVLDCKLLCHDSLGWQGIFTGVFVYDASDNQSLNLACAGKTCYDERKGLLDAFCYGTSLIASRGTVPQNSGEPVNSPCIVWETPDLAPAYFSSLILSKLSRLEMMVNSSAWSPRQANNRVLAYLTEANGDLRVVDNTSNQELT
jgi:hypothetical protein